MTVVMNDLVVRATTTKVSKIVVENDREDGNGTTYGDRTCLVITIMIGCMEGTNLTTNLAIVLT